MPGTHLRDIRRVRVEPPLPVDEPGQAVWSPLETHDILASEVNTTVLEMLLFLRCLAREVHECLSALLAVSRILQVVVLAIPNPLVRVRSHDQNRVVTVLPVTNSSGTNSHLPPAVLGPAETS